MDIKLDHLAMYVRNLDATKDFFVKYFNAESNELYHNTKTGFMSYFLSFDRGCRLEIMTRPGLVEERTSDLRYGYIHLAISAGGKEDVDALTDRLRNDGYKVVSGPRTTGDGCYESQIIGFEGNLIEITE